MRLLLDTHLLLWAAGDPDRLDADTRAAILQARDPVAFSAASIWEVAIKAGLGRADFRADPTLLRDGLLANGYGEIAVDGRHAARVLALPDHHRDPFDRILVAQAEVEGLTLLTADAALAAYGAMVRVVLAN